MWHLFSRTAFVLVVFTCVLSRTESFGATGFSEQQQRCGGILSSDRPKVAEKIVKMDEGETATGKRVRFKIAGRVSLALTNWKVGEIVEGIVVHVRGFENTIVYDLKTDGLGTRQVFVSRVESFWDLQQQRQVFDESGKEIRFSPSD